MWQIRTPRPPQTNLLTLQMDAERAGFAWTCPYSCSAEFEAAVIRSGRRAGRYRMLRLQRYATGATILAVAVALAASTYVLG